MERDDEWVIPNGQAKGEVPDGRTYIMTVNFSYWAPGFAPTQYQRIVPVLVRVLREVLDGSGACYVRWGNGAGGLQHRRRPAMPNPVGSSA